MSKLDEIEDEWKNHDPGFISSDNIDYLLKVARKAEEMAKFYASKNTWVMNHSTDGIGRDIIRDSGRKAYEFLSFLEKGDE